METLFYLPASGQTWLASQLQGATGFSPDTDPAVLASNGIYTVNQTANPYDPLLYSAVASFTIVGDYANQSWVATAYPLATAQNGAAYQVSVEANQEIAAILAQNNVTSGVVSAVAGQLLVDRPAALQTVLTEMEVVSNNLGDQLAAIAAATTVDEINDIVNPPTGLLFTGRGGGLGPLDLNVSYYNEFNSVSMPESDTELYVPGTATVIPYGSGGPGQFDSMGNCFALGDYLLQIRQASTSRVIAEFECPLAPAGEDVAF